MELKFGELKFGEMKRNRRGSTHLQAGQPSRHRTNSIKAQEITKLHKSSHIGGAIVAEWAALGTAYALGTEFRPQKFYAEQNNQKFGYFYDNI